MSKYAPVVVFAYRRPDHLRNTLASLMRCEGFDESPVCIYFDGARNEREAAAVTATRKVAQEMLGNRAECRFSAINLGLSASVIGGVTEMLEQHERIIVVEEDLQLAPSFLTFMNRALDRYAGEEKVFQVSGYQYDVAALTGSDTALFLPLTVSWGWGTWRRAWQQFDPAATGWEALRADGELRRRFNLDGAYDFAAMLERQMRGRSDSWAIRWYWSVFRKNGFVLFPPRTLARNTGFDGSGTHGRGLLRKFSDAGAGMACAEIKLPESIACDGGQFERVRQALFRQNGGWLVHLVDRVRNIFQS